MSKSTSMLLLSEDDVDALASMPLALQAAKTAADLALSGNIVTGRVQINGPAAWMRLLAGTLTDLDLLGYKEFHRVGQDVRYHVHVFRESTGEIIGVVDGRRITSLRTAATAAVAIKHWAGGQPIRLGLIGSGEEAKEGLRAVAGACNITHASVFSPTPQNRASFAVVMSAELGIEVVAHDTMAAVVSDCDVLYVATSSHHDPFLRASDIEGLGMLAAIGSTQPIHRELTGDVFASAETVVVDTRDALHESGDCIEATQQGWLTDHVGLLGSYLHERASRSGLTIFKSIGSVEQDLVLANDLLAAAHEQGRGVSVADVASLRVMR